MNKHLTLDNERQGVSLLMKPQLYTIWQNFMYLKTTRHRLCLYTSEH